MPVEALNFWPTRAVPDTTGEDMFPGGGTGFGGSGEAGKVSTVWGKAGWNSGWDSGSTSFGDNGPWS